MKTKSKAVKLSPKRVVVAPTHAVVPLEFKERRRNFGNNGITHSRAEDSKNYVIAPQHELFINGKFVAPTSGKYFDPSIRPRSRRSRRLRRRNAEDVDSAVKAARKAYDKV